MKKTFPENGQYLQNNRSNNQGYGNLWSTCAMDFQSALGDARISPRIKLNTGSLNNCPVAFVRFGQRIFALAGTTIYRNTNASGLPNDPFVADTSTSASTDYSSDTSDMIGAWNIMLAISPTKLRSLSSPNGGVWSDRATVNTGLNHKLLYFKKRDRVYFTDQTVKSMDEAYNISTSGNYTLLGANTTGIIDMKNTSQYIWFAVKTEGTFDQQGAVWQWDGLSAQLTEVFKIPGARSVVIIVVDPTRDLPFAMSDKGILYEWNGASFSEAQFGRLPYKYNILPYMGADPAGTQNNDRFVHPNGSFYTTWGTLRFLINGLNMDSGATQNENLPSGIWEWHKDFGFIHIGSLSYDPISTAITDFGQEQLSRVGALSDMNVPSVTAGRDGTFLAGATYFTNATATASAIFYDNSNDTIQKKGYMVTDWWESNEVADKWSSFWSVYRRFLVTSDSITVKWRSIEEAPISATITWINTTSFTVLNSAIDVSAYWTSGTGGEVEILRGTGGALCAHITNAVNTAGTWTVTIDETATGVTTGTAIARFQKWTKAFTATGTATPANFAPFAMGENSEPRIMVKICFTFTGQGEFYKGIVASNEDVQATK